jgi:hypothetical protein
VFSQTPAQFKGCPNFSDRGTFRYGNRTSIRAHVWPLQHVHAPKVSLLQIILTGTSCAQPKSRAPPLGFYRQCLICLYTSKKLFPAELLRTPTAAYSFHCVTLSHSSIDPRWHDPRWPDITEGVRGLKTGNAQSRSCAGTHRIE